MFLTQSRQHAIAFGLISSVLGGLAIHFGDHHVEFAFKALVALGVALVLMGLFLLRFSWTIRAPR